MSWLMPCLQSVRLKTYRHPIDMTTFTTEDRKDAERNELLEKIRQQEAELARLKEDNAELQRLFDKAMDEWAKDKSK